jgi:N-formylglutamate amidohydrolase
MNIPPVIVAEPVTLSPLVVDSPHSGRDYPSDFAYICPSQLLRQTEDFLVDELVAGASGAGATTIAATFPRSYIDVNRAENDIDPAVLADAWDAPLVLSERTALGLGLVRRLCMTGVPVYAAPLPASEVKRRIEKFYRPYHAALTAAINQRLEHFGSCVLLNCHSMPSRSQDEGNTPRPDFILGDRNGVSCDLSVTRKVADLLHDMGYSVALNAPYKGMEIVRRHGMPETGRHALQIEINRRLYMDERKLEKHDGFAVLKSNLTELFAALANDLMSVAPQQLAAE